jgi:hypothetical protein
MQMEGKILKWVLGTDNVKVWNGFKQFRIGSNRGHF